MLKEGLSLSFRHGVKLKQKKEGMVGHCSGLLVAWIKETEKKKKDCLKQKFLTTCLSGEEFEKHFFYVSWSMTFLMSLERCSVAMH